MAEQNTDLLIGKQVIVINSSWVRCPWAPFLFFGDERWWLEHKFKVRREYHGTVVTTHQVADKDPRLHKLLRAPGGEDFFSDDPQALAVHRTSLFGAMNLAYLLGARERLVLLGVDMQAAIVNGQRRTHHHAPHKWPVQPKAWDEQMFWLIKLIAPLKQRGVEVINTSPTSRIKWWRHKRLEECL